MSALEDWKEKLAYLQKEQAKLADPAQKFQLEKQIQECLQNIQRLQGNEDGKKTGKGDTEEIEIVRVNKTGKIIRREKKQVPYVKEMLPREVEMSLAPIPGGSFMMGTADAEIELLCKKFEHDWFRKESPIHSVTVPSFLMGKYPVTQQQWYAIALADFLKVNMDLNPEPSYFKGDERPVEQVNWYEAVEFCQRLSKWTGKDLCSFALLPFTLPKNFFWLCYIS